MRYRSPSPNHVWAAARYNVPGIVAHESATRDGELMAVPDFGDPPPGSAMLADVLAAMAPSTPAWSVPKPAYVGKSWW